LKEDGPLLRLLPETGRIVEFPSFPSEIQVPIGGEILPDTELWINRFTVPSDSSNVEYTIAQHRTRRWWACSCRGFTGHRKCKHLTRLGLPILMQPFEVRVAITAAALPKIMTIERSDEMAEPRKRFLLSEDE
jgi:hypothetical protein